MGKWPGAMEDVGIKVMDGFNRIKTNKHPLSLKSILDSDNRKILYHKRQLATYIENKKHHPITIEVDTSLSCSHQCPNCTFGNYHKPVYIKEHVIECILNSIPELGVKGMIITGGGEPCLYKGLGSFVKDVSESGVDITLTTNGQQFDRHLDMLMHHLKRVRFSIDAATPEAFYLTHGMKSRDFEKVLENIQLAVDYKKMYNLGIDIGVSFLICEQNFKDIEPSVELYRRVGVDFLHLKPMQYWDKKLKRFYHKPLTDFSGLISRVQSRNNEQFKVTISREAYYRETKNRISYKECHGAHFDVIVGADGKVYTCCHFKYQPKHCYGDLDRENLSNIIENVKSRVTSDCFPDCKMDSINQLLEMAKIHPRRFLNNCTDLPKTELPIGSCWL